MRPEKPKRRPRKNRVVRAKKLGQRELQLALPEGKGTIPASEGAKTGRVEAKVDPETVFGVKMEWDDVRLTAARLYGQGFKRTQIARALLEHLISPTTIARTDEQKLAQARHKLRRWEMSQEFRDMVYRHALVDLDMSTPAILNGVRKRAQRGRTDAARLALELTGRHSKEDATHPTAVTINVVGVARPQ